MTYSITATDSTTREVGGAGTSCLGGQDVYVIYAAVPERGVVHAQARFSTAGKERAAELLASGEQPAAIIASITQSSFDPGSAQRQYGIVDVDGLAAGFTGIATMPFADDRQGSVGAFSYSVQGNILTSAKVLDQAASAFEAGGCDLAERLMRALEAGASGGEGDSRCTPAGIPADSAFLQVEAPGSRAGDHLALRVESSGDDDPLPLLRAQLEAWRADHPCPVAMAPMVPTTPMLPTAPTMPVGSTPEANDAGCGCRLSPTSGELGSWLLLGSLLVVARRWRRAAPRQLHPIEPA